MITRCDYRLIPGGNWHEWTMIAIDEHPCYLRARDGATTRAVPGAPAPARAPCMQALITAPAPFSAQVLLRLPRAPAVVADADAAASRLFDEFPSLCVVVISLPVRPGADCLLMTSDDT